MKRWIRFVLVLTTALLIGTGYCMVNLRYFSRSLGWDEVYYSNWVENWDAYQVFYPHHLIFTTSSVWFQEHFTEQTGITNTTFIQKLKNTLVVSVGLSIFFVLFYLHSRRYWLSLITVLLIGFSGAMWHDATAHETAAIPAVFINLAVILLFFYRRFRYPVLLIILVTLLQALGILLHQAYFLSIPAFFLVFLFAVPRKDGRFSLPRNAGRSALYALLILLMVGGTYFYVGFVRLNLRMEDNPEGAQTVPFFASIPIEGNFVRFFYLIRAREKWGGVQENSVEHAITGYGSSFITAFRPNRTRPEEFFHADHKASNMVLAVVGGIVASFILFMVPVFRRYGPLFPAMLGWAIMGSLFVYWWEPWYIEHWLYITVLTWVLAFALAHSVIEAVTWRLPRAGLYAAICIVLVSFGTVMYQQNLENTIIPRMQRRAPAGVGPPIFDESYYMDEIFERDPGRGDLP